MKVLIFGLGGIGGLVGGALADMYDNIYFYARGASKEAIQAKGLRLDSVKLGNKVVHPQAVSDNAQELGLMDVIFLCTKGDKLAEVAQEIQPMMGPDTVLIPLLNGVLVSDQLRPHLSQGILADGLIRTFSHIESPGHIVQDGGPCDIRFGLQGGQNPESFQAIADRLTKAGIETKVSDHIELDSWKKLAITGTMSALLCYYDGNVGYVREQVGDGTTIDDAYHELQAVAAAAGVNISDDYIDTLINNFKTCDPETITSLYRDLKVGKAPQDTELDLMVGYVVKKGEALSLPTPIFTKAFQSFRHKTITEDMPLLEAFQVSPVIPEVFVNYGLDCLFCGVATNES
ncbi:MAG: 2-dehydropantoate 2-reductase, partial [Veillonella sp.]|nr:2-dehydropantoate 2-reductase [Veillonella sp.]